MESVIPVNHKLVLGTLISSTPRENKCHLRGKTKFPRQTPKMGPLSRLDSLCDNIEEAALPSVFIPEQRSKGWISETLWRFINQKNALRSLPKRMNQTASRHLTCRLKVSLNEDRKQQATTVGALVEAEFDQGKIKEAWNAIRHWFIAVQDWPLPPSREDLRKVTNDCIKLYSKP